MSIQTQTVSALTAALLALAVAGCGASPEESMRQAQGYMDKADYKAAVLELKNVLQAQPENGQARFLLGKAHLARGAYVDAEKELSRARELGVNDPQLTVLLARTWHKLSDEKKLLEMKVPENGLGASEHASLLALRAEAMLATSRQAEAERALSLATDLDSHNPDLLMVRARRAGAAGQLPLSLELVEAAIKQDAKALDPLYLKAELLERLEQPEEAKKTFQAILAKDERQFLAHLGLAQQAYRLGNLDAAEKAIQAAEKIAPQSPGVLYARGVHELRLEHYKQAGDALTKVLSITPDHLPSVLALAAANFGLGNYEQSLQGARKVLAHAPGNPMASQVLAGALLKTGDAKAAVELLVPLLKGRETDARLFAQLGAAHMQLREFDKAMDYLNRAAILDPTNPDIKSQQASGHLARGETARALVELEQASRLTESVGQADLALVVLNLRRKDFDEALQAIAALEKKLPNNPVTHNLRAVALLGKGDRINARVAFRQALGIDPTFHAAAINLARMDMEDNKPEDARRVFEAVLAKDRTNLQAMLALADLARVSNQTKTYLDWLERASKAHPTSIPPRAALVRHHLSRKEPQKALAIAKAAVTAMPDNPDALELLGTTQLSTGDKTGAITSLTRVADILKQSPDAQHRLAMAQAADGRNAAARASLRRALQLKSDHQASLHTLIRLELSDNKPEAALSLARDMQRLQSSSPLGYGWEGDVHMTLKKPALAIKPYQHAIERGAGAPFLIKLHDALSQSGDTKSAQARLAGWLKSHPEDLTVRAYAASLAMQRGQNKDAIALYEDILRKNPRDGVAANNLANLYLSVEDPRSREMAEKALELMPGNAAVLDTLGWILVAQGQIAKGLPHLAQAATQAEKHPTIQYHYAVALARSGDKAKAREVLGRAFAVDADFPEKAAARELLRTLE